MKLKEITKRCEEEIKWAQGCIDETNEGKIEYADDDKTYLPCWLKAHTEILKIIKGEA